MRQIRSTLGLVSTMAMALLVSMAPTAQATEGSRYREAIRSEGGVVASVSAQAGAVGAEILEAGGNAIDAAVATVFAVGVTRPEMCGIGGGGFLVYRGIDGTVAALDFRETAPTAMDASAFQGTGIYQAFTGHKTIGVPGTVSGMAKALSRFGTMSLSEVITPAEQLAREGIQVSEELSTDMAINAARLRLFPAAAAIYLIGGLLPYPPGSTLVQSDYADSLNLIAEEGPRGFYEGEIADLIVADMEENAGQYPGDDGLMTTNDIAAYKAKWRRPLVTTYRGHQVIAMPPPTSGGLVLVEALNILEGFRVPKFDHASADHLHYFAEAQKIAWADRDAYVADPDFVDVPTKLLSSKSYAAKRRKEIEPDQAKSYPPAQRLGHSSPPPGDDADSSHTTHVSVVDAQGNAVAVTCTIEFIFGSAVVAPGAGFLLNNQLTDFSGPGTANEPEGGKRPRSSTTPAIVVKQGEPLVVAGGAGGPRIPMGVVMTTTNVMDFGMDIAHAVDAERMNEAYCCTMQLEDARISAETRVELENRGHQIESEGEYCCPVVQVVGTDLETGEHVAASDPRSEWGADGEGDAESRPESNALALALLGALGLYVPLRSRTSYLPR